MVENNEEKIVKCEKCAFYSEKGFCAILDMELPKEFFCAFGRDKEGK